MKFLQEVRFQIPILRKIQYPVGTGRTAQNHSKINKLLPKQTPMRRQTHPSKTKKPNVESFVPIHRSERPGRLKLRSSAPNDGRFPRSPFLRKPSCRVGVWRGEAAPPEDQRGAVSRRKEVVVFFGLFFWNGFLVNKNKSKGSSRSLEVLFRILVDSG